MASHTGTFTIGWPHFRAIQRNALVRSPHVYSAIPDLRTQINGLVFPWYLLNITSSLATVSLYPTCNRSKALFRENLCCYAIGSYLKASSARDFISSCSSFSRGGFHLDFVPRCLSQMSLHTSNVGSP